MFSEALKQLIEASLVDGVLSPEERAIIIKRAMLEGNDADEVNLLLDAEIQKIKLKKQANAPKVNKCPACGEILPPLTGICPSCGYVVNQTDTRNHELDFLIEQMNRGLAQLKSGTTNAPMVIATLDEHRRRAMTLYGENPKVQMLINEVKEEIDEYKRIEAEKQKADEEIKKMEAKAKIQALQSGTSGGGGGSLLDNKGCRKGCLISFIIFVIFGCIGMCMDADTEVKVDKQYEELIEELDDIKRTPITVENFEQKVYDVKDLIWTPIDSYSEYEKTKKQTFEQITYNYIEQLTEFYSVNATEIVNYYGHPVTLNFTTKTPSSKHSEYVSDDDDDE